MILEANRRKETIMINIDNNGICRYHLDEMFSAEQEQFRDRVGDIDGEKDEEGGEGAVVREGRVGDIKGEEVVCVVVVVCVCGCVSGCVH